MSASTSKGHSFQVPPRVVSPPSAPPGAHPAGAPPAGAPPDTSHNPMTNVQFFNCCRRSHYASEWPHHAFALEHESREPLELEEAVVDTEGGLKDLIDVKNSLLHDAHLGIVGCLLANSVLNMSRNVPPLFYILVRFGETLIEMVIDGGSTMNVVAESTIKRCHLKVEPHPYTFKVA